MLPKLWTVLALLAASATAAPVAGSFEDDCPDAAEVPTETSNTAAEVSTEMNNTNSTAEVSTETSNTNSTAEVSTESSNTTSTTAIGGGGNYPEPKFKFGGNTKMRGVNLGGWLVLEKWMTGAIFDGTDAGDQWTFDEQAKANPDMMQKLKDHWASFITPDDIQQISDAGLNTVRIPVGYWSFLGGGVNGEPYVDGALEYLDPVIEKCAQLGITAFIVLHGLPGSQNGQDNSGHALGDGYQWYGNEDSRTKSVEAAEKALERYGNGKFGGIVQSIELMNEPKPKWDNNDFDFQKDYFKQAYDSIRAKDSNMNIMYSDGWDFPKAGSHWDKYAEGQSGVSMDTHIYTLFQDATKRMGYNALLNYVCTRIPDIESAESNMPTIIGEWTAAVSMECDDGDCSTQADDKYYDFLARSFETQTYAYERATGWVYWNWKLDRDDAWSFQSGIAKGWIPKDLDSKPKTGNPCQQ